MGETAAANAAALQVSVSFGRFENDSLCWEKWSTFSPNKYLEEVEKCATPGSVAEKRAYFEAHYKNIAARKAELLVQEKQLEKHTSRSQYEHSEDLSCNEYGTDAEFGVSNTKSFVERVKQENNSVGDVRTDVNNLKEDVVVAVSREHQSSSVEGENGELESRSHSSQIDKAEDVCVELEESPNIEVEDVKAFSNIVDNETAKASVIEANDMTLANHNITTKKVTPVIKKSNAAKIKKISVLPSSKASQISSPKSSRPTSTPNKILSSANSAKRENSSPLSGRKNTATMENRNVPSKTLHMSFSLDTSQPDPAPQTTVRKSLFMEQNGDKDIVKRTFKSFQNRFNLPKNSDDDKSSPKEQVLLRGMEPRAPTPISLRNENGRSSKVDSMGKRSGNAIQPTLSLKNDTKADKAKEFLNHPSRKGEEKFNGKQDEKTKHNFRATPLPAFYGDHKVSKSHQEKGGR